MIDVTITPAVNTEGPAARVEATPSGDTHLVPRAASLQFTPHLKLCRNWRDQELLIPMTEAVRLANGADRIESWAAELATSPEKVLETALRCGPRREIPQYVEDYRSAGKTHRVRTKYDDIQDEQKLITTTFSLTAKEQPLDPELLELFIRKTHGLTDAAELGGLTPEGEARYDGISAIYQASLELEQHHIQRGTPGAAHEMAVGTEAIWRRFGQVQELELLRGYSSKTAGMLFIEQTWLPKQKTPRHGIKIKLPPQSPNCRNLTNNIHRILAVLLEIDPRTPDPNWDPHRNGLAAKLKELTQKPGRSRRVLCAEHTHPQADYVANRGTVDLNYGPSSEITAVELAPEEVIEALIARIYQPPSKREIKITTQIASHRVAATVRNRPKEAGQEPLTR